MGGLYRSAKRSFYFNEIYSGITNKVVFNGIGKPAAWIDKNVIDGLVNMLASFTVRISGMIKGLQSGKIQNHVLYFFAGVAGLALIFVYMSSSR